MNNMGGGNPNPNMPPRGPMQPRRRRGPMSWFFWFWSLILVGLFAMQLMGGEGTPQKTTWSALEQMLASGDVSKIEVNNDKVAHIWLKKEVLEEYRQKPTYKTLPDTKHQFIYNIGNPDIFRSDLAAVGEKYGVEVPMPAWEYSTSVWRELLSWLPMVFFVVLMFLMFRSASRGAGAQGGVMNVGKSRAQVYDKDNANKITFKDVAGLEISSASPRNIATLVVRFPKAHCV